LSSDFLLFSFERKSFVLKLSSEKKYGLTFSDFLKFVLKLSLEKKKREKNTCPKIVRFF